MKDGRADRLELIQKIAAIGGGPILVYFTADSPIIGGNIASDAALPIFDHLRALGKQHRLCLYLYSTGGTLETPWKIVNMLREFCGELHVIVPYKAYSAATMIAIGTDKILMTRKAELGPIDPSLQAAPAAPKEGEFPALAELGVEDVAAYVTFVRERAKLTDQAAVARLVGTLAQYLTPPLLGRLERVYSHIRLVARNLLSLHRPPFDDRHISVITEALTEKMYVHGHGIGRREASQVGLDVRELTEGEEEPIWALYQAYETIFRLRESRDIEGYFPTAADTYELPDAAIACVESTAALDAFIGTVRTQRIRRIPPNPTVNVNLSINFPANVQPQQLPQAIQQLVQQALQQAGQQINTLVAQELQKQAPIIGMSASLVGGAWKKIA